MAGFDRYNNILSLFTRDNSSWTVAEISKRLKVPASTIYRNVRELVSHGFLESAAGSYLRLGPAFVEFDRTIQLTDPLIRSGTVLLDHLTMQTPIPSVAVLARLYGNKVMCVAHSRSTGFQRDTSYQRGLPMPIDRGATSLAILSQLEKRKIKRLLKLEPSKPDARAEHLLETLDQVKRNKLSVTRGAVDKGLMGYAVPIANKELGITASLSSIFIETDFTPDHEPQVTGLLSSMALIIENQMQMLLDNMAKAHKNGS